MSRQYACREPHTFQDQVVVELGSGSGIVGLAIMKFTKAKKVFFSDHTDQIINLIRDNIELQT